MPDYVRRRIDERAEEVGFARVKSAAAAMSDAYREGRGVRLPDAERTAAYLVTRMPATYAAAHAVLREVGQRIGKVDSVLDVGAGTGAASLAALEWFPDARITMLEQQAAFASAAREWLPNADLLIQDVTQTTTLPAHDLVVAGYSLGEAGAHLAARLWQAARVALVIIEPGTPRGFALIRGVRDDLLRAGAHMAAPCPAETACPLADPDWCHFAARVERSSLHRRVKGGELGYEDEKYSYVALAREPAELPAARIIRRPVHQPGLIVLETCTPAGVRTQRVPKRDRERFRAARKAGWGSSGIS